MRFVLLGPMEGWSGDRPVDLGTGRQQCVLAALLVTPDRPVTAEVLIDRVWGGEPPDAARSALYAYVARIRRLLGQHDSSVHVRRRSGGYEVQADDDAVDLWCWDRLRKQAWQATGQRRAELLDAALDLVRGRPLDNLDTRWASQVRATLTRQHVDVLADWAEVVTELGRAEDVVRRLAEPVAASPAAERLVAAYMRALHLTGRTAEALESFVRCREHISTELGVDPGPQLRGLHMTLLRGDRDTSPARPGGPAQLPLAVADFTGRADALRSLDRLLSDAEATALTIVVISGTAGVGKTALATHWAHRVARRFVDGQLHVNLNGYAPDRPMATTRALELMLLALGVPGEQIPPDAEAMASLYRTALAGKRVLVFLDNAASAEQVRVLLPGQPGCLVLVTSRDQLGGLVAMDGARRIALDVLTDRDSAALLSRLLGAERASAEPVAIARLARLCGGLPLALRIAAANLDDRPLGEQTEELADDRLGRLVVEGDPLAVVEVHFYNSYRKLTDDERRMFHAFGWLPGSDAGVEAAAASTGSTVDESRDLLSRLVYQHLVDEHRPGRYTCHDLLREYAARSAPENERAVARHRVYDWYLNTADVAMDRVDPPRRKFGDSVPTDLTPHLAGYQQAMAWLETERLNLAEVVATATAHGLPGHAWRIPQALHRFYNIRGYTHDWLATHSVALEAARADGNPAGQVETLFNLATALRRVGRLAEAHDNCVAAVDLARRVGDRRGEAFALGTLGVVNWRIGRNTESAAALRSAISLHRELGNIQALANTLGNLGVIEEESGHRLEAIKLYEEALERLNAVGHNVGQAVVLANIANLHERLGQYHEALDHHQQALVLNRENSDRQGEAAVLTNLGTTYCCLADYPAAFEHHRQALDLARDMGNLDQESQIHNFIGDTYYATKQYDNAVTSHQRALDLATTTGSRLMQAHAHRGIARALHARGEHDAACPHWQIALSLYANAGVEHGALLRAEIAGLDPHCAVDSTSK
ncbi:AfsR/SARP family transcriptional regulator [Lentzea aerocolonigenes]|uniref:AfsR/SARP family transcriptional regulator n=1 Tax=Lentzea aerocolonigenes TaxID=68170 RepID=UPI0006992388|nr:tetratricopeptide repeat protein [Lentzea aerocolonigenes]